MLLVCSSCGKQDYHVLDPENDNVFCVVCGEEIDFPKTTKVVLKSKGQVRKKSTSGFQAECTKCGKVDNPYLRYISPQISEALCRHCDAVVEVPASTIQAMKEMGGIYTSKGTGKKDKGLKSGVIRRAGS